MHDTHQKLRIWQLTVGEPIPQDGDDIRLHRAGQMCAWFAANGHHATFINSSFYHQKRTQRFNQTTTLKVDDNFDVVCLKARAYQRSISPARFASHRDAAASFREWLKTNPEQPDVIIASYPVVELCAAAADYAAPRGIPVIMDCRDFWPDIFTEILPSPLQWAGRLVFLPFERQARKVLSRAQAISGHTASAMRWGVAKAKRKLSETDFFFPFTYPEGRVLSSDINKDSDIIKLCFLGTLSHRSNLEAYIQAMGMLSEEEKAHIQLHIAGTGEHQPVLEALSNTQNVPAIFHGWLDQTDMRALMDSSDFGLLPYDRPDFHLSLPNKFIEYLAGGLPVLSCTEGEVREFITTQKCGVWSTPQPHLIADMLRSLITQKPKKKSAHIAKIFSEHFTTDAVFSAVEAQMRALVEKASGK